ncbi:ubiquinol-cytochrome c reductase iron-sulfur subunit [Derxia gummosa]|uniref:Ubiquinol-cytochrome c reductase iron-sulfur subunit n=1 Tax=Derxia gummosa DSM 723 TaxID=1121388 RepID=A0A9U5CIR0_9BURK|nr:Rieske (2Fe-2S) protein [Derxia gummosa]
MNPTIPPRPESPAASARPDAALPARRDAQMSACTGASAPADTGPPCVAASAARRAALRTALGGAALAGAIPLRPAFADDPADARPQVGDWLVLATDEDATKAVTADAVASNCKPLHVFPVDPATKTIRNGSRFNKIALVRVDPAALDGDAAQRAAGGVLAYSAVCTHQGCDVTEWNDKAGTLLCFCHFSQFDPKDKGQVAAGPASKALPWLPLRIDGGKLVVAAGFSAKPGPAKPA